ncbi:MAG: hypothetical protein ACK5MO_12440, partial [Planctomyces sp.]
TDPCLTPDLALTSVLRQQPQRRAASSPHGEFELSQHRRHASFVDGDSCEPDSPLSDALSPL